MLLDNDFNLKLTDFGLATSKKTQRGQRGTFDYMCPEQCRGDSYATSDADIFGASMILFKMLTGKEPFGKADIFNYSYSRIAKGRLKQFWEQFDSEIPDDFKSLLEAMFHPDPKERLQIDALLSHPWTLGDVASSKDIKSFFSQEKEVLGPQLDTVESSDHLDSNDDSDSFMEADSQ